MHRQGPGLFSQLIQRELGKISIATASVLPQLEQTAKKYIAEFILKPDKSTMLNLLDQLLNLAICGSITAINFYTEKAINMRVSQNGNISSQERACIQIRLKQNAVKLAAEMKNAAFLYDCFAVNAKTFVQTAFEHDNNPIVFLHKPDVELGLNALELAAVMEGSMAEKAAIELVFLYGHEENIRVDSFFAPERLSALYARFNELVEIWDMNIAALRQYYVEATMAFANAGSKYAIQSLINWYTIGDQRLRIIPNINELQHWQQIQVDSGPFRKNKLAKYLDIAIKHIFKVRVEHFDGILYPQIFYLDMLASGMHLIASPPLSEWQKHLMIRLDQEINYNNPHAQLFKARMLHHGAAFISAAYAEYKDENEALKLYEQVLSAASLSNLLAAEASRGVYDITAKHLTRDDKVDKLQKLAMLGCMVSIVELGALFLTEKNYDSANYYFGCVPEHQSNALQAIENLLISNNIFEHLAAVPLYIENFIIRAKANPFISRVVFDEILNLLDDRGERDLRNRLRSHLSDNLNIGLNSQLNLMHDLTDFFQKASSVKRLKL